LGFSLQEAYDMSWAEFVLRSIGFRDKQEREEMMVREIAYQSHCIQYIFAKGKPPKKDAFWKIGNKSTSAITDNQRAAFDAAMEQYKKEIDGN